ncbi:MAG TPA: ATP citrate lyase citrate-binding domain-containing protein [Nitrospinota bacterium]|nr:ATP citrate lyase citrate-binding domain-containing protein [Nitrospinota bacterium]
MAKVLEGPGMYLFNKWGIYTPRHVVVSTTDQIESLVQSNQWMRECKMVVKAHEAIGSRFKLGLVKIDLDINQAIETVEGFLGREIDGVVISQVIIAEMMPHQEEYYLAITSTRDGAEILMAKFGGIDVEANWDKVSKTFVRIGDKPNDEQLVKCSEEAGFEDKLIEKMRKFSHRLFECYSNEDGLYMEINPLIVNPQDGKLCALDAVVLLDGDARFRHSDWNFSFAPEFGRSYTQAEEQIMEIDSRVKGSVKLIEIPGGKVAMLPAGGGASVFYSDAVIAMGSTIANYAEYSGDPPEWAVEALTDKVCSLPGIEHIIVGGAIANFTDVKATFTGIISGFRRAKEEGKLDKVKIWVRRGGPNEAAGLESMRMLVDEGFDIHVYDRYTPLTDIVKYALKGEN